SRPPALPPPGAGWPFSSRSSAPFFGAFALLLVVTIAWPRPTPPVAEGLAAPALVCPPEPEPEPEPPQPAAAIAVARTTSESVVRMASVLKVDLLVPVTPERAGRSPTCAQ